MSNYASNFFPMFPPLYIASDAIYLFLPITYPTQYALVVIYLLAIYCVFLFMSYFAMVLHYYSSTSMELTGLHYHHYCYY